MVNWKVILIFTQKIQFHQLILANFNFLYSILAKFIGLKCKVKMPHINNNNQNCKTYIIIFFPKVKTTNMVKYILF